MARNIFRRSAIILATALALSSPIGAQSAHELFQQALSKERAEGNLPEAIKLYQRVVDAASTDHALAAKALLQLGRCYEQLGNTEARSAYERLIARYPDQTDLVAQAKSRLTALVRTSPPPTPKAFNVLRFPDVGQDGELVAVAPDGTKAIVMDYSIGQGQNLALYDFAKKQTRLLTNLNWLEGWAYSAVWSPDSRRVAYVQAGARGDRFELRLTTLEGQSNVVYRTEGIQPIQPVGWTLDGTTLVVALVRPDKTWAVGTLPVTGGRFTPLRSFGWSFELRGASPRLSPDGRFIAYYDGETGLRDVHVVSLDGRDAYRITDHPGDDFAPIWSPDSRHLGFVSNRLGSVSLWTVELKDGKPVGQPVRLKDGMQSVRLLDWTERGVFYDQQTTTWDLYTVSVDAEGRSTGAPRLIPYSRTGRNVSPVWSPDGGRLAFVSSAPTEPDRRYVVVMTADGGSPREFLIPTTSYPNPQSPYDLRWFGDGRGLGFSGTDTRGGAAVFRLVLESGEWQTIPLPAGNERTRIEWNRDGSAFYFGRWWTSDAGIFERAITSDDERSVYRAQTPVVSIVSLEFSPDRKLLVFQQRTIEANHTGKARILVLDVEAGEPRTVLEDVTNLADPWTLNLMSWTPSGDLLVKRSRNGGKTSETLIVPVNGGAPRSFAITPFPPGRPDETQSDVTAKWSPDGRSMVFSRVNRGHETFVIENPLSATRAPTTSRR